MAEYDWSFHGVASCPACTSEVACQQHQLQAEMNRAIDRTISETFRHVFPTDPSFVPPPPRPDPKAACCPAGTDNLCWRDRDRVDGPDYPAWCLNLGGSYDAFYEPVLFCPWCGMSVPADP